MKQSRLTITTRPSTVEVDLIARYLHSKGRVIQSKSDIIREAVSLLVTLIESDTDYKQYTEKQAVDSLIGMGVLRPYVENDKKSIRDGLSLSSNHEHENVIDAQVAEEALRRFKLMQSASEEE